MRSYIVENSELRLRVSGMEKAQEAVLRQKEEEYVLSKKTLEEEYRKRLEENQRFRSELEEQKGMVSDLQEVVASQKEELRVSGEEVKNKEAQLEEWKEKYSTLSQESSALKSKCDAFEAQKDLDQRKRREISLQRSGGFLHRNMEIERRVIQREREVIKSALFRVAAERRDHRVERKRNVCKDGGLHPAAVPLCAVPSQIESVSIVASALFVSLLCSI